MIRWLLAISLVITPVTVAASHLSSHSAQVNAKSPATILVYEHVIIPWLHREFARNISDDIMSIRRKILVTEFYRFENIDGQTRYSVHIEYAVRAKDMTSESEFAGIRAQEIVFLIEDQEIVDYYPFDEYTLE